MNDLRLYVKYLRLHFLAGLQYKGWPLMMLQVLIVVISEPIGVILLISVLAV